MRLLILSDSHGLYTACEAAVRAEPTAQVIFHLGDGAPDDLSRIGYLIGDRPVVRLPGNCDGSGTLPREVLLPFGGKKFFACHGDAYYVKYGTERLEAAARAKQADVVLYGHTHTPDCRYSSGLYIFNPGAVLDYHYGVIDITPAGDIVCINKELRR